MGEGDKFIKNEISPKELCEFLVDEVYSKYPQFVEMLGGNEKAKKILASNVVVIKRFPNQRGNTVAEYNLLGKSINIYLKDKVTLENIKKNIKLLHTIVHESIHAVLNTSKNFYDMGSGCYRYSKVSRSIIRDAFKVEASSSKNRGIIGKKIAKEKYYRNMEDKVLGVAVNEGVTEWLVKKMLGERRWKGNYEIELEFVSIIETIKGEDSVLRFAAGDYNSMMRILHMKPSEIVVFLKCMDMASWYRNDMTNDEKYGLTYEELMSYDGFHAAAEKIFIEAFLLYEIESLNELNVSTKPVFNLYKGVASMHKIDKLGNKKYGFTSIRYEDAFFKLRSRIEELFIFNSNYVRLTKISNSEITALFMMYNDFIKDRDDKISGLPADFEELMNSKGNIYGTILNPIYGENNTDLNYKDLIDNIRNNDEDFER